MKVVSEAIKLNLDGLVEQYETPAFIEGDPISVPHRYTKRADIEIAGFFAAIFAWGQRTTIINKANQFIRLMDDSPHSFIIDFQAADLKRFSEFKHRTFQPDDAISFLYFLQSLYRQHESLETLFLNEAPAGRIAMGLQSLRDQFANHQATLPRSLKHLSNPATGSACKRLNMFLRWMVRSNDKGVDFGIWKQISPAELIIPLDLHVFRSAKRLDLLEGHTPNWKMADSLTKTFKQLDAMDPVKYDFALFNLSLQERTPWK